MDEPGANSRIRIGSLNVHSFMDEGGRYDGERICDFLIRLKPTILALQEARTNSRTYLADLVDTLKMKYAFAPAEDDTFGNVLMWRTPVRDATTRTGYLQTEGRFRRSYCAMYASVDGTPLSVCVTHLDHHQEHSRLLQLYKLHKALAADPPLLLLGDFNSLLRSDYSPQELEEVKRVRRENRIEAPQFAVMDKLKADYIVCPEQFKPTCPYNTRVDYVLVSRAKLPSSGWRVESSEITDLEVSDHAALVTTLRRA